MIRLWWRDLVLFLARLLTFQSGSLRAEWSSIEPVGFYGESVSRATGDAARIDPTSRPLIVFMFFFVYLPLFIISLS